MARSANTRALLATLLLLGAACSAGSGGSNGSTSTSPGGTSNTPSTPAATTGINDAKVKILATGLSFPFNVKIGRAHV